MPANYLMSWDAKFNRWSKMLDGVRYVVSVRQLSKWCGRHLAKTKEGSYKIANSWWQEQLELLNKNAHYPETMVQVYKEELNKAVAAKADPEFIHAIKDEIRFYQSEEALKPYEPTDDERIAEAIKFARKLGIEIPETVGRLDLIQLFSYLAPEEAPQKQDPILPDLTVAHHVNLWLKSQEARVVSNHVCAARYRTLKYGIEHYQKFIGSKATVDQIAPKWEGWFSHCMSRAIAKEQRNDKDGWSRQYAKEVFATAKRFVNFLYLSEVIELPRNLANPDHTFKLTAKQIKTISISEFTILMEKASPIRKLYLLLMANCGFRGFDISDIRDTDVDWDKGTLTKKRTKTKDCPNAPTVQYLLWQETFNLLKKFRSGENHVLVSRRGKTLATRWLEEGEVRQRNSVARAFADLKTKCGIETSLGTIRKKSASLLESHDDHSRHVTLFLGHAPSTMSQKHYAQPPQESFNKAIRWLGEQYGY